MSNRLRRSITHFLSAVACVAIAAAPAFAGSTMDAGDQAEPQVMTSSSPTEPRPACLAPLYVAFGALQVLDVHSTLRATGAGAREANPFVGNLLSSPAAFVASKAGVAAGMIFVTERLRKRHPRAAVLTMVGLNSAYAVVVGHNYAVGARAGGVP